VDIQDTSELLALHCNYPQKSDRPCACRVEVGWLTSCAHLFCTEHAKQWFASNVDCPVCRAGGPVRMLKVNCKRPRKERNLAMLGFLPSQVFQAASEAFEFWAQQKMLEHDWQAEASVKLEARESRLRGTYQERAMEVERVISQLSEQKYALEQRLCDMTSRGDALRVQAEEAQVRLERLRRRCEALEAADDGWRAAPAWRGGVGNGPSGGAASATPGAPMGVPPPPPAFAGRAGGLSNVLFGGDGAKGTAARWNDLARRGLATPAGFSLGRAKRRRIT